MSALMPRYEDLPLEEQIFKAVTKMMIHTPFYGHMLVTMPIIVDPPPEKLPPDFTLDTAATNGTEIFINGEFFKPLPHEEKCFVLAHEVMHWAFGHFWRRGHRDQTRSNVAQDEAINYHLSFEKEFKQPAGTLRTPDYDDMAWEAIYEKLPVNPKPQSWGQHSLWGMGQPGGDDGDEGDEAGAGQQPQDVGAGMPLEQQWVDRVHAAYNEAKRQGKMPSQLERAVLELLHPTLDWRQVLWPYLSTILADYDLPPPDRRFAYDDLFLPTEAEEEDAQDVVFWGDTSGSVSEDDLAEVDAEMRGLLRTFPHITGWRIACDAQVHAFGKLEDEHEWRWIGGGGTDFRPVFDKIAEEGLQPRVVVGITDLCGTFPDTAPPYPVIWLCTTDLTAPFGTTIKYAPRGEGRRRY